MTPLTTSLGLTPSAPVGNLGSAPFTTGGGRLQVLKTGTPSNPTNLQSFEYNYDAVGNVNEIKDYNTYPGLTQTQTQTFHYDNLDRLGDAVASGGSGGTYTLESYTYDPANGNLWTKAGVSYGYNDPAHEHAVTHLAGVQKYWCDANGNMTTRIVGANTYSLSYDAENRLITVSGGGLSASHEMVYDGDGNRVKGTIAGVSTVYISNTFEWTGSTSTMKKYYYASGVRVAMREGSNDPKWLLSDHLSSTAITASFTGSRLAELAYKAWGETRYTYGTTPTTYRYTGQRQEILLGGVDGLYFYNARWYDSYQNFADAYRQIGQFLEDVYNTKRIHSSLGYLTPLEFEAAWQAQRAEQTSP